MIDLEEFVNHLINDEKLRKRLIQCPWKSSQHGTIIQRAFIEIHPKWRTEVSASFGLRPNERFDLYLESDNTIKIIEIASLRGDQISKNFVSRIGWCIEFLRVNPKMKIGFAMLCYDSSNRENRASAISYLRSCQSIVSSLNVEISFYGYVVQDSNFRRLE